jgi:hypothetical protein
MGKFSFIEQVVTLSLETIMKFGTFLRMNLGIISIIIGIIVAFFIYNLQKQKGRLLIDVKVTNEIDDSHPSNCVYMNQNGIRSISLKIVVKNNHRLPVDIAFFFLGVPKIKWFFSPVWLLEKLSMINYFPLPVKHKTVTLMQGEESNNVNISGFNVAETLQKEGLLGNINVMVVVCDEKKNIYYSRLFPINMQEWMMDKGNFLMGFFENGII